MMAAQISLQFSYLFNLWIIERVYDEAGNVIETREHKGDFKEW